VGTLFFSDISRGARSFAALPRLAFSRALSVARFPLFATRSWLHIIVVAFMPRVLFLRFYEKAALRGARRASGAAYRSRIKRQRGSLINAGIA